MKNNLDTPVAKQCRALYTKYRTRTYVWLIKSWPQPIFLGLRPIELWAVSAPDNMLANVFRIYSYFIFSFTLSSC